MSIAFNQLKLAAPILSALEKVGYETPSPIQAETIPLMLEGRDVLGQAQTGTGKTAAFALPLLSNLDLKQKDPQVLVLAPTRELAIQVAEAFQTYASNLPGFHVLPIYGGQDYRGQLKGLQRGVHVVVGTPGRVMDHMRRGSLKLDKLTALVLDEADEMLRMGFIDDVEWILEQTPPQRQVALFSATMPSQIKRIANKHLKNPAEVTIKVKTTTAELIRQRYWMVSGLHKLDALTRILEAENFDAILVFVRTKIVTQDLADKLSARGYSCAALNGDIEQKTRERTVESLKNGKLDIIVATDVAARGLDVERISHVINYDIPNDTESYVHRIGRTGRAGRSGEAILFVAPRERRMLLAIERATRKKIEMMELPSTELINDKRIANFKQSITDLLAQGDLGLFSQLIEQYQQEHNIPALEIAAALAKKAQGKVPLLLQHKPQHNRERERDTAQFNEEPTKRNKRGGEKSGQDRVRSEAPPRRKDKAPDPGQRRYRVEVGHVHKVEPGNLVGAIANEAGLDAQFIGRINIQEDHSLIDLPDGMPKDVFQDLKKVWVAGQQLQISLADDSDGGGNPSRPGGKPSGAPKRRSPKGQSSPSKGDKPKKGARKSNG